MGIGRLHEHLFLFLKIHFQMVFQLDIKQETVAHAKIVRFLEGATMCQAVELVDRLNDSLLKDIEFIRERDATREAEIDSLIAEL